jgi:hypothetical protein
VGIRVDQDVDVVQVRGRDSTERVQVEGPVFAAVFLLERVLDAGVAVDVDAATIEPGAARISSSNS